MNEQQPTSRRNIVVYAVGSRGDVQPSCLLASALRARGHTVHMATEERLRTLVDEFGLPWRRLEGDVGGVLHEPAAQAALRSGSLYRLTRATTAWDARFDRAKVLASFLAAADGADVVVGSALKLTEVLCVAQARRVALVALLLQPTWPTSAFPFVLLPVPCSCLNRWSHAVAFGALWAQERAHIEPWRAQLGLPPLPLGGFAEYAACAPPTLIAASELLCGPAGEAPSDYPPHVLVGGFLLAPPEEPGASEADRELLAFVCAHKESKEPAALPLVYFGFGSMPAPQPLALLQLVLDTCAAARCRGVLVAGWTALLEDARCAALAAEATAAGTLLVRKATSHGWLLPRCDALVHHCGVGTLGAALAAGVPQVPCPFMLDQPHNAALAVRLGVAPEAVPFDRRIGAGRLARALRAILDERGSGPLCESARRLGERVRAESSRTVERLVAEVESARPAVDGGAAR